MQDSWESSAGDVQASTTRMSEVLLEYPSLIRGDCESLYRVLVCGRAARDGTQRWHGWVEFLPRDGGPKLRTRTETTQPNRTCTAYWATGLSRVYLEGALRRARRQASRPAALAFACRTRDLALLQLTDDDRRFLNLLRIAAD